MNEHFPSFYWDFILITVWWETQGNLTQSFHPPSFQLLCIWAVWPILLWFFCKEDSGVHFLFVSLLKLYRCISVVLLSWCWDSCRYNRGAIKNQTDGELLLETDILPALLKCRTHSKLHCQSGKCFFQPFASLMSDCLFWTISRSSLWACGTLFLSRVFRSLCNRCCSCVGITHWMQQTSWRNFDFNSADILVDQSCSDFK